jgi:hypothetical protein
VGIRVAADKCAPVGGVSRGGATNSLQRCAATKYIDWMKKYAPEATGMFGEAVPVPAQIAQQIFGTPRLPRT